MLSLVLQRRKFGKMIKSYIKLKLPDGSEHFLRELFEGRPAELLSAFRANQWTIPAVCYFSLFFFNHLFISSCRILTKQNSEFCILMFQSLNSDQNSVVVI
jgi:hypothetical protein